MADETVAVQPSDPSTTTVQDTPSPMLASGVPGMEGAAQILSGIQQQNAAMTPPPNATAPMDMGNNPAPYLGTPTPPDVAEHMGWLHKALDEVGNALAGPKEYKLTKNADGSSSVEPMPSTTGEKWGRIAAAALGGAAKGFAASQGPGGLGKAAAAGVEYGTQLPVSNEQQRQQEADFQNKQLLAQANRIHLTQETYMLAQQAKLGELEFNKASEDAMNRYADALTDSPNAVDLGKIDPSDPNSAMNLSKSNPGAMDAFLGRGDKMMRYVTGPDHQLHMIMTDKAWEQQRNDAPMEAFYVGKGADGAPTLMSQTVPVNADTRENINNHNAAAQKQFYADNKSYWDAKKSQKAAEQPAKVSGKWEDMYAQAANEPDQNKRGALLDTANQIFNKERELKLAGRATAASVGVPGASQYTDELIKPGAAFGPGTVNGTTSQQLASGDTTLEQIPKRMAKGAPTPMQYTGAADAYSREMYGLPYSATLIDQEKKQFENLKQQGALDGIDRMGGVGNQTGYLDQLATAAQKVLTSKNAPTNRLELWAKAKMGDQDAKDYETVLGEVQRSMPALLGNPLIGGADTDLKLKQAIEMIGSDPTNANTVSRIATMKNMMTDSRDSYARNNRFIQRRYGLQGPYAAQFQRPTNVTPTQFTGGAAGGTPAPQPAPKPAPAQTPQVPAGKIPAYQGNKLIGYADDNKGTNYHAF